jgi:SAM-dependent methyltransferase
MATTTKTTGKREYYDDPDFNYLQWWGGRSYEHLSEVIAIRRLLDGRRFGSAVDVGGGYGRLSVVLADYADTVTLIDPSSQQLGLARTFLERHPAISARCMSATRMEFPDASTDLVTMVRVMHHLPDPAQELAEVSRILRPGGYAIIEAANSAHAINRLRHLLRGEPIPAKSVDIRPEAAKRRGAAPFVNHNPRTVARQLRTAGLQIRSMLSVSNLRHPVVKDMLPEPAMLAIERAVQEPLAGICFGPSMFFLAQKLTDHRGHRHVHVPGHVHAGRMYMALSEVFDDGPSPL